VDAGFEPVGAQHRLRRFGDGNDYVGVADGSFAGGDRLRRHPQLALDLFGKSFAMLRRAGEYAHGLDLSHRANRGDLRQSLTAAADHAERTCVRIGENLRRQPTRRAGAHAAEVIGLDHRLEAAVARRIKQHMEAAAGSAVISLQPENFRRAPGGAHQIERTFADLGALPRQIGGGGIGPGLEHELERRDRILDGHEALHVGFGQIKRPFRRGLRFGFGLRLDRLFPCDRLAGAFLDRNFSHGV